jgi:hypothetical protein
LAWKSAAFTLTGAGLLFAVFGGVRNAPSGDIVVRGSDLHPVRFAEILAILLPKWQDTDPYLDDFSAVMRNAGDDILVRVADSVIDGVLRTKCIRTGGDPRRVPVTFEQLVGPYWSRRDPNADTRILVDLTKLDGASGVAKTLVESALDRFQEPNLWTFSPEDAVGLHTHFGACAVHGIPAGRPRHAPSHVVVMSYRGSSQRDQTAAF